MVSAQERAAFIMLKLKSQFYALMTPWITLIMAIWGENLKIGDYP